MCLLLPTGAAFAQGLSDKLELHGSVNAAYGRASDLPVFGIPTTGTSDYRVVTLQARYSITANDKIVAQVFNRRLGTSPLAPAIADLTMQWAYWQHTTGSFTFKAGRSPLPRGLSNEIRYIGTVNPFFRPALEVTQDAFDAVDGAVASYRHTFNGVELEQHAFVGGSESRQIASTSAGQEVRIARDENLFGSQSYVTFPIARLKIGAYGARYNFNQATSKGYRTNVILSAEATVDRVKLETEHSRITGPAPITDNRSGYYQGTVRVADRVSFAGQYAYTNRQLYFTNLALQRMLPEVRTKGASAILRLSNNSVIKFEQHWRGGWSFDSATPSVAKQTATDVTLTAPSKSRYYLISIAASF